MKTTEWCERELADLERAPPQGTTWAVFAILAVIAHTLLRIEARLPTATEPSWREPWWQGTHCGICGYPGGHGGLPCPKTAPTASSAGARRLKC